MAANGTVDIELPGGTESHNGEPVYIEGQSYTMSIKYSRDEIAAGHTAVISVPKGFTISQAPEANTAVQEFVLGDGTLTIKFKDPIPVSNGAIDLSFTVDTLTESSEQVLNWGVNGEETSQVVVFKKKGDDFAGFGNGSRKEGNNPGFSGVTIVDGEVVLGDDYLDREITYSITVDSKDERPVTIADTLATGMTLVSGSFTSQKTVWDAKGLNKVVGAKEPIEGYTGTAFSHTFTAEQNSIYVLQYRAKIADAAALEQLRTDLQAKYDAVKGQEGKAFSVELTNSATINGEAKTKTYRIGATTPTDPRPDTGAAFKKGSDLAWNAQIMLKDDGVTLDPALPVNYTLTADLTKFKDFASTKYALARNVVITDTLPANLQWLTNDTDFISAGYQLVSGVTPEALAGDEYVGSYTVDGQTVRINVGKDVTKTHAVQLKAQLLNIAGAQVTEDPEDNPYAKLAFSNIENKATFEYADGGSRTASTWHQVVTEKDPKTGINDGAKFAKRTDSKPIVLEEGQTVAEIPFTFTVAAGIGDAAKSTIVDRIDHTVLDVSADTLAQIKASITGKYDPNFPIDGSSFDLSLNEANNLVFTPNAAFPKAAGSGATAASPLDKRFEFTVKIPTKPIEGKAAITVKNNAEFLGEDREIVFTSKTTASAGAGGREIDVTKTVYNKDKDDFTTNLRAEVADDGSLVEDEYVYRVQFIPTLGYSKMLFDIKDQLVNNLEFVGFVDAENVENGTTVGTNDYRIPGTQLTAKYSKADNRITIAKDQALEGGKVVELFFKARIANFTYGEGVENAIGAEKVTITPTNDFPLDISKLNEKDPSGTPITDRDARFELRNAEDEVVLKDLYIVGGKLRMVGETGGDAVPTVKTPGTYTVHETKAPAGYVLSRKPVIVIVNEDGTSQDTKFFNTPRSAVKKVSVGDYVWLDVNRDGIQDQGEDPIQGVKLALTGPNGQPVTDIDGNLVEPVVTNDKGFYEFIDLPALQPGETYTVSIVQDDEGTIKALEGLIPTKEKGIDDREKDSSTWTAVSRDDLVSDGDRDPSLDFGFHSKSVSVGDYVWLDFDADGIQGTNENEKPISGVKLVLTGPDGQPVTDVFGDPVAPVVTNEDGFYEFIDLPALQPGETYKVSIDREDEGTQRALEGLVPTKTGGTDDRELDSSEWTAISRDDLVNDGDRDPSLDFGFRVKSVSVGDYVWLDVDGDGVQGTHKGETPIQGVKLVLTGPDGNPVTDVFGKPVAPVVTDKKGFYEFPNLPALKVGETYTVSIDQEDAGTQKALEGLIPTKTGGTDDRELDSSEWTAISRDDLVNDGDRDPSLDFGFKYKTYAIGDIVWIDTNKDGLQGDTEYVLKDVIVRLFDKDGNEIAKTKTDKNGLYVFDELRAGKYRVQFELTPAQAKIYKFTKLSGGDSALDSNAGKNGLSTWITLDDSNADLTLDYAYADLVGGIKATQGIDPTWDAGVIVIDDTENPGGPGPEKPTKPTKPTPPTGGPGTPDQPKGSTPIGGLPVTGGSFSWGYVAGGAALLLAGAGALLLANRRRVARHS